MNQKKIGSFLKELRKEKGITQEQFAERLNISGRTVSRWENGNNMPDISLLVEIADFFDVSIPEIINGERKSESVEKEVKEVAEMLSDYAGEEKTVLLKRARIISIIGLFSLLAGLIMETISLNAVLPIYECVKGICFGLAVGALITMVLYTTGILAIIKDEKTKQMKVLAIVCFIVLAVCIIASLTACASNTMADIYDNDAKIVSNSNSYNLINYDQNIEEQKYMGSIVKIEEMDTVWTYGAAEDVPMGTIKEPKNTVPNDTSWKMDEEKD